MDYSLAYALSMGGFMGMALWWVLFGKKVMGGRIGIGIIYASIYIMLGVLSIKYIDVLPIEFINPFKYLTIALVLVGGIAIILGVDITRLEERRRKNEEGR